MQASIFLDNRNLPLILLHLFLYLSTAIGALNLKSSNSL